jgi:hypothetical protein
MIVCGRQLKACMRIWQTGRHAPACPGASQRRHACLYVCIAASVSAGVSAHPQAMCMFVWQGRAVFDLAGFRYTGLHIGITWLGDQSSRHTIMPAGASLTALAGP